MNNYFNKSNFYRVFSTKNKPLIIGETKHFAPASREWTNNVYSFNKNSLKHLPVKYESVKELLKGYFYLDMNKKVARSRRMRARLLKSNIRKIFVSKPQIKLTNDKVIVTVFTYNNEKRFLSRKIFYYDKKLSAFKLWQKVHNFKFYSNNSNSRLTKHKQKLNNLLKNKLKLVRLKNRVRINFTKTLHYNLLKKYKIPYNNIRYQDQMGFLFSKIKNISKEISLLHKLFYLKFLRYILSIFNIKIYIFDINLRRKKYRSISEILSKTNSLVVKNNICFYINNNIYSINLNSLDKIYYYNKNNKLDILNNILTNRNFIITQLLYNILEKSQLNIETKQIKLLFNTFANKYLLKFINKNLKQKNYLVRNYYKLMINKLKFNKFLPGLKLNISKIYNKKTELNIIDLKYLQLNTDIFVESIALRLKQRHLSWPRVLSSFLGSVKFPENMPNTNKLSINNLNNLNLYKSIKINNEFFKSMDENKDSLQNIIHELYPHVLVKEEKTVSKNFNNRKLKFSKINNILNIIKYKWMTGIKLEIAGRLTRRYTASRSLFKFKYKGNLKGINYINKSQILNNKMSSVMIRNHVKSNIEFGYIRANKRIGAFGVKGWTGGY